MAASMRAAISCLMGSVDARHADHRHGQPCGLSAVAANPCLPRLDAASGPHVVPSRPSGSSARLRRAWGGARKARLPGLSPPRLVRELWFGDEGWPRFAGARGFAPHVLPAGWGRPALSRRNALRAPLAGQRRRCCSAPRTRLPPAPGRGPGGAAAAWPCPRFAAPHNAATTLPVGTISIKRMSFDTISQAGRSIHEGRLSSKSASSGRFPADQAWRFND